MATEGDEARREIIKIFDRMAAHCQEWLVAHGVAPDEGPVPGLSDVQFDDQTRHFEIPTNVPANTAAIESLHELYAAEGALLNYTQRALMEHHLRFREDSGEPGYLSVPEQNEMMEAFAAKVRGETDELTRKTYAVYNSGPPETHRVMPTNDDEDLLQEWAKKRGAPNEAEMHMLAKYIGVDVFDIYDWFKAKTLQTEAIGLVLGEAFSRSPASAASRKIGMVRWQAAGLQTKWLRKLNEIRENYEKAKRAADGEQGRQGPAGVSGDKEGKEVKFRITMKDVRGEMKPFICLDMD